MMTTSETEYQQKNNNGYPTQNLKTKQIQKNKNTNSSEVQFTADSADHHDQFN